MPLIITVINRAGDARVIDTAPGASLMEAIRAAGIDEMLAMCGGNCSCATCHVTVEACDTALSPRSDLEQELLENSLHHSDRSRLSCQIPLTAEMNGLRVRIAPED